jgi:hypothetical protein
MQIYPVANYGASIPALQPKEFAVGGEVLPLSGLLRVTENGFEFAHDGRDPWEMQKVIIETTKALLKAPGSHNDFPAKHEFIGGMYIRRLFIPKGQILVGKVHKLPCVNVVERGAITVLTATGSDTLTAGYTLASPAGIQKLGIANEDTVFVNIFRTDETDPDKIEDVVAWDIHESMERQLATGDFLCQLQQ